MVPTLLAAEDVPLDGVVRGLWRDAVMEKDAAGRDRVQKVLAQPNWLGKFTPRDYAALTPLIWEHVNPYGRFDLDMNTRLALL